MNGKNKEAPRYAVFHTYLSPSSS